MREQPRPGAQPGPSQVWCQACGVVVDRVLVGETPGCCSVHGQHYPAGRACPACQVDEAATAQVALAAVRARLGGLVERTLDLAAAPDRQPAAAAGLRAEAATLLADLDRELARLERALAVHGPVGGEPTARSV